MKGEKGKVKGEVGERLHRKLEVWRRALSLAKSVYEVTCLFPKEETYGLVAQMRRAAVSVPSNLAEGAARTSKREFLQFISVAQGSLSELDTQLELSMMLGFIEEEDGRALQDEIQIVSRLLYGLARSVKETS